MEIDWNQILVDPLFIWAVITVIITPLLILGEPRPKTTPSVILAIISGMLAVIPTFLIKAVISSPEIYVGVIIAIAVVLIATLLGALIKHIIKD